MAVFQGSRVGHAVVVRPRLAARGHVRVGGRPTRRIRPAGLAIGFILVATLLGLVYQTQTLRSAATTVEIGRLVDQRNQLLRALRSQSVEVLRWSSQAAVTQWAQNRSLDDLGDPLVLEAR